MGILKQEARSRWLYGVLAVICTGVLCYSQVTTLDWDEGFHLVAASLIAAGKRPYIDFCFPQPSLHAWWNALWLSLTGGGWRGPHVIAALLTCGAIVMTANFVRQRATVTAGCVAALLLGLNAMLYEFGTTAQAYGAGLFLTVAAFCVTVKRPGLLRAIAGGCLAGAAAGCSLLTAPACLVLLLWHCSKRRWSYAAACLAGMILSLSPILAAFATAPHETWFNLVDYHVFYRSTHWTGATLHDFEVLASWVDSGQALLLGLFAVAGLWFIHSGFVHSGFIRERQTEFYFAALMAAALGGEAAVAHPTFAQYFIFMMPFLAMPAAVGFCEVVARLSLQPRWMVPPLAALLLLSLGNSLVEMRRDNNTWTNIDFLAQLVTRVTPANGVVLADPPVYFAMRRLPPPGMEFPASHKLELPAALAASLHIVPQQVLEQRVSAGEFATVETCKGDEDEIQALALPKHFARSATIADCSVYWGFK